MKIKLPIFYFYKTNRKVKGHSPGTSLGLNRYCFFLKGHMHKHDNMPNMLPLIKMADNIFKCIFLNDIFSSHSNFTRVFFPGSPTVNKPALVSATVWHRTGDKPYLNQWWPSSITPYNIIRPRWDNDTACVHLYKCYMAFSVENDTLRTCRNAFRLRPINDTGVIIT